MTPDQLLEELRGAAAPRLVLHPEPREENPPSMALVPGSFDPMTVAHAALAEAALDRADLVALVYSVRTLPKEGGDLRPPLLPEADRLAILDAYCRSRDRLATGLCSHGLLVEQVQAARARFPAARLLVVVGSDKLVQLFDPKWYPDRDGALDALFADATVCYAMRAGEEETVRSVLARAENARWRARLERLRIRAEIAAVSGRRVRELIELGSDFGVLVPDVARGVLRRVAGGSRLAGRDGNRDRNG